MPAHKITDAFKQKLLSSIASNEDVLFYWSMLSADADEEDTRHGERQQTSASEKIYQVEQLKLTANNDTSTTITVHASSTINAGSVSGRTRVLHIPM